MLEELDKVVNRHLIRWTGGFYRHWSQFLDVGDLAELLQSFLDLAVSYGLNRYVHGRIRSDYLRYLKLERMEEDPAWVRQYFSADPDQVRQVTLLEVAVRPDARRQHMAQILLEHGADPNKITVNGRTWDQVLKRAITSVEHGVDREKWLQIMKLFVQRNVDLRGGEDLKDAWRRIFDIIDKIMLDHPREYDSLRAMIDTRLPESIRKQLKLWASDKLGSRKAIVQ